jgi:hypothetical protein
MASLARRIASAQQRLAGIYRLELPLRADDFVLSAEAATALRPGRRPRTGLLALEEAGTLWLGLYFDPRDAEDPAAILEETSHWVAVVWHAVQERPVSPLLLELQADVDRYAVARMARARDPLRHFASLRLRPGLSRAQRSRYRTAHLTAFGYCRALERRFPRGSDLPGLLRELRGFYRRSPAQKLAAAGRD